MKTLTFTQKLLRQRRFLSLLLPLFALFVGLGSFQSVMAQPVISNNVTLNVSGTNGTYDTQAAGPGTGIFSGTNFGTFDLANPTNVFNLNGLSFVINDPFNKYNSGIFSYEIYQTSTGPSGNSTSIVLGAGSRDATTGVRTFTSALNVDLLAGQLGGTGINYSIDVVYVALDKNFGPPLTSTPTKTATFTVTGARVPATNISNTTVIIDPNNITNGNTTYNASAPGTPKFNGANLGVYDINTGQLILNGGTETTFESGGDAVLNATLYYRIFKSGQNPGVFSNFSLQQTSVSNATRQFSLTNAQVNAVSNLANLGNGTFNIQVYYQSDVKKADGTFYTLTDNNMGANYTAQFTTSGTPIETDTWTGTINDDWFNPGNWSLHRTPDAVTNVVIPNFPAGSLTPYPNIWSGVSFTASNGVLVNNTASGPALSRNLFLTGTSSTIDRSVLRLNDGTLKIYGDFSNQFLSYISRDKTNTEFASSVPQQIAQGSYAILTVSGGGTKSVTGTVIVNDKFVFDSTNGNTIVTTDPQAPGISIIKLADRLAQNLQNGAQLVGETNSSYVLGLLETTRAAEFANAVDSQGNPIINTYGNIGITTYFTGTDNPGDVKITRSTQDNYFLMSDRLSVRRVFGVQPSNQITSLGRLRANLTFTVLPNETINLRPNNGSIAEQNLSLFLSTNNGDSFGNLGRDATPVNYTVTKSGVRNFATFTLGDILKPLPVRLTAFDAKRVGVDALVTWQTAAELNSKGYDVQVSTNGKEFRTLSSVPSASPNSVKVTSYSYLDTEKGKTGTRYYRLRQVDLDGIDTFFSPVAVNFEGKAPAATMVAYPNPFNGNDELHMVLQSATAGKGQLLITDLTGRVIRNEKVEVSVGLTDFAVNNTAGLQAGMYLVKFTLPTGEVKNLKVQKQ